MTRVIAVANQKGGVGKTTTVQNLSAALKRKNMSCLLIDLDPQASLTTSSGIRDVDKSIYDVLTTSKDLHYALLRCADYDIIPSNQDLSGAELELSGIPGREYILKEKLDPLISRYDYIFIDCPPGLGLLTLNALTTATELFIPLQAEYLALDGLARLLNTVKLVQRRLNQSLAISGIIITRYDQRRRLNREVLSMIQDSFPGIIFSTPIRENISLAEAPSFGQNIFEYKKNSNGAEDYTALADQVISREASV